MEFILINLLNGLSYGLLLFMLSAGLTLIFSMMGVLNFSHAAVYMLGAYLGYSFSAWLGFWWGLCLAPLVTGLFGALIERFALRRVHQYGQISQLLLTFGLSYLIVELVQLLWGRTSMPYAIPPSLQGTLLTIYSSKLPLYRGFMMAISLVMLLFIYILVIKTKVGLIIRAALTQATMLEALGHNLPRIFMWVFAAGCALAGLAGAVGGAAFATEPNMAASVGSIIFVVIVVGGMGSLKGVFLASLLVGLLQTFAVTMDYSPLSLLAFLGLIVPSSHFSYALLNISISQLAPVLPYLMLILILIFRPQGLLGNKDDECV
ncbi:MAG: branched-chain amino acid ABC transporter permease [Undibacterium sp.]|nr:branched-chain amino acid ABC transporter permease [Undibacterium sp.]